MIQFEKKKEMEFSKAVEDLKRAISEIFDDDRIAGTDLYAKHGALTYLVGNVNSIGLKEKQTAPFDRQVEIDTQLSRLNSDANQAFARLDRLTENPLPVSQYDRPRVVDEPMLGQTAPSVNVSKPKVVTDPKPAKSPVQAAEASVSDTTNPFIVTMDTEPVQNLRAIDEDKLLNAIYNQIHSEFNKIRINPEFCRKIKGDEIPETDQDQNSNDSVQDGREESPSGPRLTVNLETVGAPKKVEPVCEQPKFQMKFDRFQLSVFAGDYTEWISFRDEFLQLIHTNSGLIKVFKFQQLKTHLKGVALDTINGFKLCAADYQAAWDTLVKRYDNDHRIVTEYIKRFFEC